MGYGKTQRSTTLENWDASILLIWKMEKIKRLCRTQERNWKFLWKRLCLQDGGTRKRATKLWETVVGESTNSRKKTKYACIVEAHKSTRKPVESTPRDHGDHIAEKGFNSLIHYNVVHKFFSDAPSDENSGCESRSGQIMGEAREDASVATDESQIQKWGDRWSKD